MFGFLTEGGSERFCEYLVILQDAIRKRAGDKIAGGKIIKIEAHPIPENYRPRRVVGKMALVGDAAG